MSIQTIVHGLVTRDPYYMRGVDGKKSVLNVSVECGVQYKSWIDLALFGEAADKFADKVKVGDHVLATANSVRGRGYTNASGEVKASVSFSVGTFQIVDSVGAANNAVANADAFSLADDF